MGAICLKNGKLFTQVKKNKYFDQTDTQEFISMLKE